MKPPARSKKPVRVGELIRKRLRETNRTPTELAEAAHVPTAYIADLIAGRRRPPLPSRTDVYDRMTAFLKLGRTELAACAQAERDAANSAEALIPKPEVGRQLLALCDPNTARELEERGAARGDAEMADLIQRLLDVTQGAVRRVLDDQVGLRIAAERRGSTYVAMRLRVLDFLDATPDTLTLEDLAEFFNPRVTLWDVDFQTGVLRVVLRGQEPKDSYRRRPSVGWRGSRA